MEKVQTSHTHQRKTEYIDLKQIPAFGSKRKEVTLGTTQIERTLQAVITHLFIHQHALGKFHSVTIEKVIGKGAFGQVAKGTAIDLRERPGISPVAVKMLKGNPK